MGQADDTNSARTRTLGAVSRTVGAGVSLEPLTLAEPCADEVRVRLVACAICHSDLSAMDGDWRMPLPAVFGHEAAGVVESLGADVSDITVGTRVLVSLFRWCGACAACLSGRARFCDGQFAGDTRAVFLDAHGEAVARGFGTAAFSQATVVHSSQVFPLPNELSCARAALISCGVLTGYGAVSNTARVAAGESVAVLGAGGVGLNCIQAAALSRAACVAALDRAPAREAVARTLGATHFFRTPTADGATPADANTKEEPPESRAAFRARVLAETGARDGFDHVLVAAGVSGLAELGLDLLRRGGSLTLLGMPPDGSETRFETTSLVDSSLRILGSKLGEPRPERDFPRLLALAASGRWQLEPLLGRRFPFREINAALAHARDHGGPRTLLEFTPEEG